MLSNFLFYFICSSAVLIYGIGLNRVVVFSNNPKSFALKAFKMLACVSSTVALTYLLCGKVFIKADLSELYPFVALLIFTGVSVFLEVIVRITSRINTSEFAVSFLCILLGLGEGTKLSESILISCFSAAAFYILVPVLYAIRKRLDVKGKNVKVFILIYLSIAVIIITLLAWNVTWLNPEVLK
ncbi:MAG: hypothetical protein SO116_06520 [Treponema sp.]|nr:hypothetical protein [Treponema sp.]